MIEHITEHGYAIVRMVVLRNIGRQLINCTEHKRYKLEERKKQKRKKKKRKKMVKEKEEKILCVLRVYL